tara:strand:- start:1000 stop:2937 length:1938 start_codon:yes stop_codon:yes gene_type:complete
MISLSNDVEDIDLSSLEEMDDIYSLKNEIEFQGNLKEKKETQKKNQKEKLEKKDYEVEIGREEQKLLEIATKIKGRIDDKNWDEVIASNKEDKYTVVEGDWLWKICKRLFGDGFYYSKIWSLNPYITNPHEIEPGMVLVFDTGDSNNMPKVLVDDGKSTVFQNEKNDITPNLNQIDAENNPSWLDERKKIKSKGVYIQYTNQYSYEDITKKINKESLKEYEKYSPMQQDGQVLTIPKDEFDDSGFDRKAVVRYNIKEKVPHYSFLSSNIIIDLGSISASNDVKNIFMTDDIVYVDFNNDIKVSPGDKFSIYSYKGNVTNELSGRVGRKYIITGHVKVIKQVDDLWKCKIIYVLDIIKRHDRLTVFIPQIERIEKTYNSKIIDAILLGAYNPGKNFVSIGDTVYIDRGKSDGVEVGNIFEVYSSSDPISERQITKEPTLKIGEIMVTNLSDDFSTGVVIKSKSSLNFGQIAVSKSKDSAVLSDQFKNKELLKNMERIERKSLDELDVDLNLNEINDKMLEKVDNLRLEDDEIEALEKEEREKSRMEKSFVDVKELEKLENEIEDAEKQLREKKLDEDNLLEQEDLNVLEKKLSKTGQSEFPSLNQVEKEIGRKYIDQNLNTFENPYGLSRYDLEEVDEMLNSMSER